MKKNLFLRHEVAGFTLIESLIVVAIAGILAAIALPNFSAFIISTRLTSQANDLVGDLRFAQNTASNRGKWIHICPSADGGATCSASAADWKNGRIVFSDVNRDSAYQTSELLRYIVALSGSSTITPTISNALVNINFSPYGGLAPAGTTATFKLCSPSSGTGRVISIATSGKPSVTTVQTCP